MVSVDNARLEAAARAYCDALNPLMNDAFDMLPSDRDREKVLEAIAAAINVADRMARDRAIRDGDVIPSPPLGTPAPVAPQALVAPPRADGRPPSDEAFDRWYRDARDTSSWHDVFAAGWDAADRARSPRADDEYQRRVDAWVAQRFGGPVDPGSGEIAVDAAAYASGAWCRIDVHWTADGDPHGETVADDAWQFSFGTIIRELLAVDLSDTPR